MAAAAAASAAPTLHDLVQHVSDQFSMWVRRPRPLAPDDLRCFACPLPATCPTTDSSEYATLMCALAERGFQVSRTTAGVVEQSDAVLLREKKVAEKAIGRRPYDAWTLAEDDAIRTGRSRGKQFRAIARELGIPLARVKERYLWLKNKPVGARTRPMVLQAPSKCTQTNTRGI